MRLYLTVILICIVSAVLPHNIIASDTDYYIKILQYGTDSDIANAFSKVYDNLGGAVNESVFKTYYEPHSEKMRLSLIRYLSIVGAGADCNDLEIGETATTRGAVAEILKEEMTRDGVSVDYLEEVIHAAGEVKTKSCVEPMRTLYHSRETPLRIKLAIVDAWGKIDDKSVEDLLIGILQDDYADGDLRARAVRALGEMESSKSMGIMIQIAKNTYEPKLLRMYAVLALSKVGKESVLDTLEALLDDGNHEVAEYAARAIAEMSCDRCAQILMRALRSDYDKVRYYAVIGLASQHYTDSIEILKFKAEYDENEIVRDEAKKAVASLSDTEKGNEN
jgi:HEAT repeat protein